MGLLGWFGGVGAVSRVGWGWVGLGLGWVEFALCSLWLFLYCRRKVPDLYWASIGREDPMKAAGGRGRTPLSTLGMIWGSSKDPNFSLPRII